MRMINYGIDKPNFEVPELFKTDQKYEDRIGYYLSTSISCRPSRKAQVKGYFFHTVLDGLRSHQQSEYSAQNNLRFTNEGVDDLKTKLSSVYAEALIKMSKRTKLQFGLLGSVSGNNVSKEITQSIVSDTMPSRLDYMHDGREKKMEITLSSLTKITSKSSLRNVLYFQKSSLKDDISNSRQRRSIDFAPYLGISDLYQDKSFDLATMSVKSSYRFKINKAIDLDNSLSFEYRDQYFDAHARKKDSSVVSMSEHFRINTISYSSSLTYNSADEKWKFVLNSNWAGTTTNPYFLASRKVNNGSFKFAIHRRLKNALGKKQRVVLSLHSDINRDFIIQPRGFIGINDINRFYVNCFNQPYFSRESGFKLSYYAFQFSKLEFFSVQINYDYRPEELVDKVSYYGIDAVTERAQTSQGNSLFAVLNTAKSLAFIQSKLNIEFTYNRTQRNQFVVGQKVEGILSDYSLGLRLHRKWNDFEIQLISENKLSKTEILTSVYENKEYVQKLHISYFGHDKFSFLGKVSKLHSRGMGKVRFYSVGFEAFYSVCNERLKIGFVAKDLFNLYSPRQLIFQNASSEGIRLGRQSLQPGYLMLSLNLYPSGFINGG